MTDAATIARLEAENAALRGKNDELYRRNVLVRNAHTAAEQRARELAKAANMGLLYAIGRANAMRARGDFQDAALVQSDVDFIRAALHTPEGVAAGEAKREKGEG